MKPFRIDFEKLDGMALLGNMIEIQGAMSVREEIEPLEGVHQSSLSISVTEAARLQKMLTKVLLQVIEDNKRRKG